VLNRAPGGVKVGCVSPIPEYPEEVILTSTTHATPPLSRTEALRGIYIDFEGRLEGPPVLLGVLWVPRQGRDPRFVQYIVDSRFRSAVSPPRTESRPLERAIELLVRRATDQRRVLIGWSTHEVDVVREHAPGIADQFEAVYRDGKAAAKRWRSRERPDLDIERDERKRKHRLSVYAQLFDYPRPDDLGVKDVGMALGRLRSTVASVDFEHLDDRKKCEWEMVLRHNEFDCRATRHVCVAALDSLGG
jgi:hypothetical protein